MKTMTVPRRARFFQRKPENAILVENNEEGVVIKARWDNYSEARKRAFIREVAAEGFIPDHFQWLAADTSVEQMPGLAWVIDGAWAEPHVLVRNMATRRLVQILVSSSVLWLLLMCLLLAGAL